MKENSKPSELLKGVTATKTALLSAILHLKKVQSDSGKGWGTHKNREARR